MRCLLTGGSANGKSTYAEALAAACPGPRIYLACMRPYGAESERKIARHRQMRAEKGFVTVERYTDISHADLPARAGVILLECLCNLTANELFDDDGAGSGGRDPAAAERAVLSGVQALSLHTDRLIVVTNEVGADGMRYGEGTVLYARLLGRLNALLAASFERVTELVCGVHTDIKGEGSAWI